MNAWATPRDDSTGSTSWQAFGSIDRSLQSSQESTSRAHDMSGMSMSSREQPAAERSQDLCELAPGSRALMPLSDQNVNIGLFPSHLTSSNVKDKAEAQEERSENLEPTCCSTQTLVKTTVSAPTKAGVDSKRGKAVEEEAPSDSEEPLYVNARQYRRMLKRRIARVRFQKALEAFREAQAAAQTSSGPFDSTSASVKDVLSRDSIGPDTSGMQDKKYLYESRHRHAMKRPRGPGGRFLTSEEVQRLEEIGHLKDGVWIDGLSWRNVPGIDPKAVV